jgi:hypothetical protein
MSRKWAIVLAMLISVVSFFVSGSAIAAQSKRCGYALTVPTKGNVPIQIVPCTVPTVNEWGMIIFMVLAGIGSVLYIRRNYRKI